VLYWIHGLLRGSRKVVGLDELTSIKKFYIVGSVGFVASLEKSITSDE
jgi:hypothetical protein